jgi:hypothetical protein
MIENIVREAIAVWAALEDQQECGIELLAALEDPKNDLNCTYMHGGEKVVGFFNWIKSSMADKEKIDIQWISEQTIEIIEAVFHILCKYPKAYSKAKKLQTFINQGVLGKDIAVAATELLLESFTMSKDEVAKSNIREMIRAGQGNLHSITMLSGIQLQQSLSGHLDQEQINEFIQRNPFKDLYRNLHKNLHDAVMRTYADHMKQALLNHIRHKVSSFESMAFKALCPEVLTLQMPPPHEIH